MAIWAEGRSHAGGELERRQMLLGSLREIASFCVMAQDARPTVHTDALDTLGSIIGPEERRDAIHLAVYPIEAGELLQPGQHVQLDDEDGLAYRGAIGVNTVGIVDPFLRQPVKADERFWLVVYPREISSLRHVWEHHAFPHSGETSELLVAPLGNRKRAEEWLRSFADRTDVPSFEDMVAVSARAARNGDGHVVFGDDANGEIPPEFWSYLEEYLDERFPPGPRAEYFSCAC